MVSILPGDMTGDGDVAVWEIYLNCHVGDSFDPGVVGVEDQGVHGSQGIGGRDEATVSMTHSVKPPNNLKVRFHLVS